MKEFELLPNETVKTWSAKLFEKVAKTSEEDQTLDPSFAPRSSRLEFWFGQLPFWMITSWKVSHTKERFDE